MNVHEAKTTLSRLLRRVAAGESIVISRRGKPAAELVPFGRSMEPRRGGADRGCFRVPDDFDAEDPAITQSFEG